MISTDNERNMSHRNNNSWYDQNYGLQQHGIDKMCVNQYGRTQLLVNNDQTMNYKLMEGDDRKRLQKMKHDLTKIGVHDPDAEIILTKYGV